MRGQVGAYNNGFSGIGDANEIANNVNTDRPALPEGVEPGYHEGSHGPLTCDFIDSLLRNRRPTTDIANALNLTVAGIVAHQSALKDGELLKIPQYEHLS